MIPIFQFRIFWRLCRFGVNTSIWRNISADVFQRLDRRMRKTGQMPRNIACRDNGRPRTSRTPENEEAIVDYIDENPSRGCRGVARTLGLSKSLVQWVLATERYHPYHYTRVQALQEGDFDRRTHYCTWLQQQLEAHPNFSRQILWTDESIFTRDGIFNKKNNHYWATQNPHLARPRNNQFQFSVNVWAGILDQYLIGPVIFPARVNHHDILHFINNQLDDLLYDVPLARHQNMLFQLDGAPVHHAIAVQNLLNANFPRRWMVVMDRCYGRHVHQIIPHLTFFSGDT
jgi:hypothetical protein